RRGASSSTISRRQPKAFSRSASKPPSPKWWAETSRLKHGTTERSPGTVGEPKTGLSGNHKQSLTDRRAVQIRAPIPFAGDRISTVQYVTKFDSAELRDSKQGSCLHLDRDAAFGSSEFDLPTSFSEECIR